MAVLIPPVVLTALDSMNLVDLPVSWKLQDSGQNVVISLRWERSRAPQVKHTDFAKRAWKPNPTQGKSPSNLRRDAKRKNAFHAGKERQSVDIKTVDSVIPEATTGVPGSVKKREMDQQTEERWEDMLGLQNQVSKLQEELASSKKTNLNLGKRLKEAQIKKKTAKHAKPPNTLAMPVLPHAHNRVMHAAHVSHVRTPPLERLENVTTKVSDYGTIHNPSENLTDNPNVRWYNCPQASCDYKGTDKDEVYEHFEYNHLSNWR